MSEGEFVGKITHCFASIGCVAIRLRSGSISVGDTLLFVKGDPPEDRNDKDFFDCSPDAHEHRPNWHKSCHPIQSIQIDGRDLASAGAGVECAVKIVVPGQALPPNNAVVHLVKKTSGSKPYFA
jgi:hypothetical protein